MTGKAMRLTNWLLVAMALALPAVAVAQPKAGPGAVARAGSPGDPKQFVAGLYERLDALSQRTPELAALHRSIAEELQGVADFGEMARLSLVSRWGEITAEQRTEFTELLRRMVTNNYVRRFKPGSKVEIGWGAVRKLGEGKTEVATTVQVKKTSAEVRYALHAPNGQWRVYDIVVDDASQVQTYRQSFKKILDKEGWAGLIKRMKKAADKKA